MRVLVLGAGVIGVTSAWFLSKAGHEVVVIDRCGDSGLETSFANGGQISVGQAEPWANPGAPISILKWMLRENSPLFFRPRADLAQWVWGIRFLFECMPSRTRRNIAEILKLGLYSQKVLRDLRRETAINYDHSERGILAIYTDKREFFRASSTLEFVRQYGCIRHALTQEGCLEIEPALENALPEIVGGIYTPADESGDAFKFTRALTRLCRDSGVQFRFNTQIMALEVMHGLVSSVRVKEAGNGREELLKADAYIICMGSYSPLLLRSVGIHIPIYPVKGYSVTMPVGGHNGAPSVSITDHQFKLVFSRLGERLRVAGMAELAGYDRHINPIRCNTLLDRVFKLFPDAGSREQAEPWAGLRPATPGNVPYIGPTRYGNLFLNTGHGTLGWTLSCGSGRAIADIVSNCSPEVDFSFTC